MKKIQKISIIMTAMLIMFAVSLNITGCSSDNSPMAPEPKETPKLQMLKWNDNPAGLKKVLQVSQLVTIQNGGELKLKYKSLQTNNGEVDVFVVLNVFPNTISQDAELMLTLDDELLVGNVDMKFSPHGITFSRPAKLEIRAEGMDLSGFNPDQIQIYYDNEDTGHWELMKCKKVKVDPNKGSIQVIYAEIPHFSRYALAHSE
jgi:hypothetical protein